MTKRIPLFITLVLASALAAPPTWAATGNNSCRPPAIIVDVDQVRKESGVTAKTLFAPRTSGDCRSLH